MYGFTGAAVGQLPCLPIASTVTAYGRQLLLQTKAFVEQRYTQENGFDHNAEVVYGDTDSVRKEFCLYITFSFPFLFLIHYDCVAVV